MKPQNEQTVAIVGGGQAGFQVAASLREFGFPGAVTIYADEAFLPYQRPPLSKTYLKEGNPPDKVYLRPQRFFEERSITVEQRAAVAAIDRNAQTIALADGRTASWDHLVLATGVTNRRLPVPGAALDGVVMLRGLDDAHAIRDRLPATRRIVIIGGGVIGLEMAALARGADIETHVVELGDRLAGRIGSAVLSEHFLTHHRALGAILHLSTGVSAIEGIEGKVAAVILSNGTHIPADMVLVCIGVSPNTSLAEQSGLAVNDGILVDEHMRTSDPAILAAGDCTRFKPAHGQLESVRLESVQNAIDQGKTIAETIVGRPRPYDALPWFWSDQGTLKLQIAGLTTGHDRTIVKSDPAKSAVTIYCFAADRLIGVECINRPADFMAARRVLTARRQVRPSDVEKSDFELKAFMT